MDRASALVVDETEDINVGAVFTEEIFGAALTR